MKRTYPKQHPNRALICDSDGSGDLKRARSVRLRAFYSNVFSRASCAAKGKDIRRSAILPPHIRIIQVMM